MGYATVCNIPRIHNYKDAFNKWQSTKPIRGREPEIRPLGERRDCDTYSIRKNVWTEVIECVLYTTPVVKFTPDNEVLISFGQWASASTCQFITRLVVGVGAHQARGNVVLHFNKGVKAIVEQGEELALVQDPDGNWMPKVKQTLYDYRVNRKEANNVRKQVSQFRDYMSGVVKLKAEPVGGVYGQVGYGAVRATYDDLIAVFGVQNKTEGGVLSQVRPDVGKWVNLNEKPRHCRPDTKAEHWAEYRERAQRFFDLVKNDQDDNVRHQNYWIAFNILLVQDNHLYWRNVGGTGTRVSVNTMQFEKLLDKFLLTMFSDRAFKKIALPDGKVPSNRYDNYVLTEKD